MGIQTWIAARQQLTRQPLRYKNSHGRNPIRESFSRKNYEPVFSSKSVENH